MREPMAGVRVIEVAMYGFVTSGGAVLADWGADVLKIEHPVTGDPQRGLRRTGTFVVEGALNPNVEHPNRGKRSIGLDIASERGREVLYELVRHADVFLTSLLPRALHRFHLDVDSIRAVNPDVVYARGSALGTHGDEAERGGYDMTAFWCRASTAASISPPGIDGMIPPPVPAYGDTISGTYLAGGIAAALFGRERTGEPSVVDVSLLGSGLWSMGMGIDNSLIAKKPWIAPTPGRAIFGNPLSALYKTADDRYLSLVMLQPARYWSEVCHLVGRSDLADDPRFSTAESIEENIDAAVDALTAAIASQPLAHWTVTFAGLTGPWAPVQDSVQVTEDAQVRSNSYIVSLQAADGGEFELVTNPVQFDSQPPRLRRGPAFAEHTDAVLEELGYDWDRIVQLKVEGVVT